MKTSDVQITFVEEKGCNLHFTFLSEGFHGKFRLHCDFNYNRKGQLVKTQVIGVYFNGFAADSSQTSEVYRLVDACLFVERFKEWLLQQLRSQQADMKSHVSLEHINK